jgi:hypothetical protein
MGFQASVTALRRLQVSLVFDIESAHDVLEALPSTFTVSVVARLVIFQLNNFVLDRFIIGIADSHRCHRFHHTSAWPNVERGIFSRPCDHDNIYEATTGTRTGIWNLYSRRCHPF